MRLVSLILAAACALVTGCMTRVSDPVAFVDAPVSYRFVSEIVDEETMEHRIKFRNTGAQIVSFDYTVSDAPGVPHLDCLGPNSGLVENLYPGAEVEVKNPIKEEEGIFVVLGRMTYGKRTAEQLAKVYKPSTLAPAGAPGGGSSTPLPLIEPVNVPGE